MNGKAAQALALSILFLLCLGAADVEIPAPRGFVSDYADVIDPVTERRLAALLGDLKQKTGSEIAILTVRSTKPETAFDYSLRVAEQWKPGAKEKDNGVVFLVAVDDRQMFVQVGYGIEGVLPDGKVGAIRDEFILPRFKRGDYASGIWDGTVALATAIAHEYGVSLGVKIAPTRAARGRRRTPLGLGGLLLLAFFVLLVRSPFLLPFLLTGSMYRRGYWGGGFGGGGFGGGGGGFGGGSFGGGGAGGSW